MGFTRAELESFRDQSIPDLVGPDLKLLIVGINPGLWTAAVQTPFAHPGNRFYPALRKAGIIDRDIDPAAGFTPADREYLINRGIGCTNLVNRATARADELASDELQAGAQRLRRFVIKHRPRVVAMAGITAYRIAFGTRTAKLGRQSEPLERSQLWLLPNPSGLNAHETIDSLATKYAEAARAADLI